MRCYPSKTVSPCVLLVVLVAYLSEGLVSVGTLRSLTLQSSATVHGFWQTIEKLKV